MKRLHTLNEEELRMVQLLIGIAIGLLIGWNWPQPFWARRLQERFVMLVRVPDKRD